MLIVSKKTIVDIIMQNYTYAKHMIYHLYIVASYNNKRTLNITLHGNNQIRLLFPHNIQSFNISKTRQYSESTYASSGDQLAVVKFDTFKIVAGL